MMEAGRELDALVHTRLFHGSVKRTPLGMPSREVPLYSTDYAMIPDMMEQMRRYTFQFERHHRHGYYCKIILPGECMVDRATLEWDSRGESLPHATCLATLKVMASDDHRRQT